jgi:hypothetical protein
MELAGDRFLTRLGKSGSIAVDAGRLTYGQRLDRAMSTGRRRFGWWLAFRRPGAPLGIALIDTGAGFVAAIRTAVRRGCYPGGSIEGWEVTYERLNAMREPALGVLLTIPRNTVLRDTDVPDLRCDRGFPAPSEFDGGSAPGAGPGTRFGRPPDVVMRADQLVAALRRRRADLERTLAVASEIARRYLANRTLFRALDPSLMASLEKRAGVTPSVALHAYGSSDCACTASGRPRDR